MELKNLNTFTFIAPSGNSYEIREQNGEDEDILSNRVEMRNLVHLSRFISAIVVKTSIKSGRLTLEDALKLPLLDRYCILIQSRIFSIGNIVEFDYQWTPGRVVSYEEDLNNYLLDDYSKGPTEEELNSKPYAIPSYINPDIVTGIEFTLDSGKVIRFKAATGNSEQMILKLSEEKRTNNAELRSRGLELLVDNNWELVHNFSLFSVKDMAQIRKLVSTYDPSFMGISDITDPNTGETMQYAILAAPSFFFPTEL